MVKNWFLLYNDLGSNKHNHGSMVLSLVQLFALIARSPKRAAETLHDSLRWMILNECKYYKRNTCCVIITVYRFLSSLNKTFSLFADKTLRRSFVYHLYYTYCDASLGWLLLPRCYFFFLLTSLSLSHELKKRQLRSVSLIVVDNDCNSFISLFVCGEHNIA